MKLKIIKEGNSLVYVNVDGKPSELLEGKEKIIEFDRRFGICDNPLNISRCIVTIEVVK